MKNTILAVAACVALAGCQTPPPGGMKRTTPTSSDVTAYVTILNGKPYVHPEGIVVRDKNVKIYWYLDPDTRHVFTDDGIEIADRDGEFDNCKAGQRGDKIDGGLTYVCKDKNNKHNPQTHPRIYKYKVKLQPAGGGAAIELDPWVVND